MVACVLQEEELAALLIIRAGILKATSSCRIVWNLLLACTWLYRRWRGRRCRGKRCRGRRGRCRSDACRASALWPWLHHHVPRLPPAGDMVDPQQFCSSSTHWYNYSRRRPIQSLGRPDTRFRAPTDGRETHATQSPLPVTGGGPTGGGLCTGRPSRSEWGWALGPSQPARAPLTCPRRRRPEQGQPWRFCAGLLLLVCFLLVCSCVLPCCVAPFILTNATIRPKVDKQ